MKIALDAMGGDLAPRATVEGAALAARDFGIEIVLVGDRDLILSELSSHEVQGLPIAVEHAQEVVAMDEAPLESVLSKPNSSIHAAFDLVKRGQAQALVSAGNSGAVMAAGMAILSTLPGVDRPAIGALVPTTHGSALLIDAGANTEVKPLNLVQFALMGSIYAARVRHISRPRVALLSNGEESSKGTDLTRLAAATLEQIAPHVNYIGYIEGRDINRGMADVVVSDGFTGNVALKTMEGFAAFLGSNLLDLFSHGWRGRLAFLLLRRGLADLRARLDPSEYGGAPLLGLNGMVIIAHGSSNPRAIRNAIRAAADEALVREVNGEIAEALTHIQSATPAAKGGGKGIRGLLSRMRERLHRQADQAKQAPRILTSPATPQPDGGGTIGAPSDEAPDIQGHNGAQRVSSESGAADRDEAADHQAKPGPY